MVTDLSRVNNNWIYQGNKLIEASYSFTVLEQKLIRLLASMIKKDDEEFEEYKFKAIDLCKILNIHQKNIYMELDRITDKLMARYIKIKNDDTEKFKKRHLIKIADFEDGILTMKIDEDMKEFYLKLNWYTKYQLKNIMQFKSTYSFRVYELLKQYESIRYRIINIDDLRIILDISKEQYPKYANLKQKVINVALKEINNNTDLHIEFEELKKVRKVESIKFIIKSNIKPLDEVCATKEDKYTNKQGKNFTELVREIKAIFKSIVDYDLSDKSANEVLKCAIKHKEYGNNPIALIKEVAEYSKTQNINTNLIGWFKNTVSSYEKPRKALKMDTFSNYQQRTYDFDKLERNLLGWDSETDEVTGENYLQDTIRVND